MTTIQPPPAPDANTAISAFSTSARQTFDDFLEANSSRYRITREKRSNIISWIMDDQKTPTTQTEHNLHHHALHSFKYDTEKDILTFLPSDNHPAEQQVVVQEEIFRVIEQEHLLSKHAGQDTTWASIRGVYYGIS